MRRSRRLSRSYRPNPVKPGLFLGLLALGLLGLTALWARGGAAAPKNGSIHAMTLRPGAMTLKGFHAGDTIFMHLPSGAKWGGVINGAGSPPLSGAEPYTLEDDAPSGNVGITWWDAGGNPQATTVVYGP